MASSIESALQSLNFTIKADSSRWCVEERFALYIEPYKEYNSTLFRTDLLHLITSFNLNSKLLNRGIHLYQYELNLFKHLRYKHSKLAEHIEYNPHLRVKAQQMQEQITYYASFPSNDQTQICINAANSSLAKLSQEQITDSTFRKTIVATAHQSLFDKQQLLAESRERLIITGIYLERIKEIIEEKRLAFRTSNVAPPRIQLPRIFIEKEDLDKYSNWFTFEQRFKHSTFKIDARI